MFIALNPRISCYSFQYACLEDGYNLVTSWRTDVAVRLQVMDTIRSYELNFHPVPHGVRVSCGRYRIGFPVCYGSQNDVFAASSGIVH